MENDPSALSVCRNIVYHSAVFSFFPEIKEQATGGRARSLTMNALLM